MFKQLAKAILPRSVLKRARHAQLGLLRATWRPRQVTRSFCGVPLHVYLGDPLAAGWYDHDWPDCAEAEFIQSLPQRDTGTFFDLGAHQAVVALMIQRLLGRNWKGIAVEGTSMNVEFGLRNLALNHESQITLLDAVVAEKEGFVEFNNEWNGSVSAGEIARAAQPKRAVTIDGLAAIYGRPDAIFLDVEGFEGAALQGAQEVLRGDCAWFIEIHAGCGLERYGGAAADLIAAFPEERYTRLLRYEDDPAWRPADPQSPPTTRCFLSAIPRL